MTSKPISSRNKKVSRMSTLRLDSPPPAKRQKLKPLSLLSQPPIFELGSSQLELPGPLSQESHPPVAPKPISQSGFQIAFDDPAHDDVDDQLWVDKYAPQTEGELAVHARKVRDVKRWFLEALDASPTGKLHKYRRILVLTGPAGTAKTATVRVLAKELGFDIIEWKNTSDERFDNAILDEDGRMEYEGLSDKFRKFFARATSCNSIFQTSSAFSQPSERSLPSSSQPALTKRRVILLEDLPNVLHSGTQEAFHAALKNVVTDGDGVPASPVVIILSDAGVRGEDSEDPTSTSTWKGKAREAVDVRTVLPGSLLASGCVTQISFNPIASTVMKPALQRLVNAHFSSHSGIQPSKDLLNIIVDSSNGDIRSAIMALQFACIHSSSLSTTNRRGKKGRKTLGASLLLEAVTRREQTLALFHLIGKILYNKRKGDSPTPSASAKDIQRDKDIDARLVDPPKLPPHLSEHNRKASRVNVEALYADSPIDASLLSLYIHQNYHQYCEKLEECYGVMDWLSWVDANGGESWLQANPQRFHLVTLGTMHSLPNPVPRRSQKPYKPEFFESLNKGKQADDALRDVHYWLRHQEGSCSGWTKQNIATELPAVLKARELSGPASSRPPKSHRLFSTLQFSHDLLNAAQLADEGDIVEEERIVLEDDTLTLGGEGSVPQPQGNVDHGGWLENDDIEDF